VSGSGKSSLAFDILFEEGRGRYLQSIGFPYYIEKESSRIIELYDLNTECLLYDITNFYTFIPEHEGFEPD
jgi:hypothetical protein